MNELTGTAQTMSSREIAELTGKEHRNVLADIRKMLKELEIEPTDFSAGYQDTKGETRQMFNLPRRECDILVSGYSIKYRAKIIDRWQELEGQQKPMTHIEMLAQQAMAMVEVERKQLELAEDVRKLKGLTKQLDTTRANQVPPGYLGTRRLVADYGRGLSHKILMDYVIPYYKVSEKQYMVFHEEGGLIEARCFHIAQFRMAVEQFTQTLTQVTSKFCESDILPEGKRVGFILEEPN